MVLPHAQTVSGGERLYTCIYHLWEVACSWPGLASSPSRWWPGPGPGPGTVQTAPLDPCLLFKAADRTFGCSCNSTSIWKLCCAVQCCFMQLLQNLFGPVERRMTEWTQSWWHSLLTVNRCEDTSLKRLILQLTKDMELVDSGNSMSDLSVVRLPCKIPCVALCCNSKNYWWPENIWQNLPSNISNLYSFNTALHQGILEENWTTNKSDMLFWFYLLFWYGVAKDPWHSSSSILMQRHLIADWGQPASLFYPSYCMWNMTCLYTSLQVSVCIFQCRI